MKMVARVLVALLGVVVILAGIGLFLPSETTVKRSIQIDAPPATVFALVNNFRHFNRFSPWADRDPGADYEYSGTEAGVGARMSWTSEELGSGYQEITASEPYREVAGVIGFEGQGTADIAYLLDETDQGTELTWSFHMDAGWNIIDRYFGLLMDDMLGGDYELGLQRLKKIAEEYPSLDLAGFSPDLHEVEATPLLLTRKRTVMSQDAMEASMRSAFDALDTVLALNQVENVGMPRVITLEWDEAGETWTFEAAYELPPATPITRSAPGIERETSYAGPVMEIVLKGADWQESTLAYEKAELYLELHGWEATGNSWEAYESDPRTTPPEELVTHIVMPIRRIPIE